jgi:hypothetical protein
MSFVYCCKTWTARTIPVYCGYEAWQNDLLIHKFMKEVWLVVNHSFNVTVSVQPSVISMSITSSIHFLSQAKKAVINAKKYGLLTLCFTQVFRCVMAWNRSSLSDLIRNLIQLITAHGIHIPFILSQLCNESFGE